MKALILDSGVLITLSMNGLLDILRELKKTFDGKFLITQEVKAEVIDHPIGVKKFELGALRVQNLLDEKIIEMPQSLDIQYNVLKNKTFELMDIANHSVKIRDRWIRVVSDAEISCIALSLELSKKGIETMIAIDERTLRVLVERPENLEKMMSERMHQKVDISPDKLKALSQHKFIRSSELVYVAYKKGLIPHLDGRKALEALLYATKFKGSSISFEEIDELKKL